MDRGPELCFPSWRKLKGRWKYADDGIGLAIQPDGLADDVFSPAEPLLPRLVGCDHIIACARLVFAIVEVAPEDRSYAENAEESCADSCCRHGLDTGRCVHQVSRSGVRLKRAEA